MTIPEEYGGLGLDLLTYALIQIELSRGWMSLSGVLNTHFISAWMIRTHGTDEQRERYLPRMATGELRFAYSMTEPHAGSDVQAIRTRAVRDGDELRDHRPEDVGHERPARGRDHAARGHRPGRRAAAPRHDGVRRREGARGRASSRAWQIPVPPIKKLGYKGVESTELLFDGFRTSRSPAFSAASRRDRPGLQPTSWAGSSSAASTSPRAPSASPRAAFEEAIRYAQQREAFGKPIAQHQAVQLKLAQMATRIEAARLLTMQAAERKNAGERADLEAGMAKLFATETAAGGRARGDADPRRRTATRQEFVVERIYRDAPVLILGEGSNEIQQLVIARRLLERYAV